MPSGGLFEYRRKLAEHRTALAGDAAGSVIDALITVAPASDDHLKDDFCVSYGAAMAQLEGGALEDMVNPEDFTRALLTVIDERQPNRGRNH